MSIQIFLLYLATWSLVALTPGPAVMCSMAQSTRYGFRSSLAGVSGIQCGNFLFFVCIAFGLGTLLATATTAFVVLRVLGAIYLFYLGARIIISSFWSPAVRATQPVVSLAAHHNLFLQGLLIQLTNPKALLFISALLPQFIEPHRSVPLQLAHSCIHYHRRGYGRAVIIRILGTKRGSVVSAVACVSVAGARVRCCACILWLSIVTLSQVMPPNPSVVQPTAPLRYAFDIEIS